MNGSLQTFLLALSALFSIVNPLGSALIFSQVTGSRSHAERTELARKIAFYSAVVMLGALWGGAYILSFFGVSLSVSVRGCIVSNPSKVARSMYLEVAFVEVCTFVHCLSPSCLV